MPISVLAIPLLPLAAFVLTLLFGRQIGTKVHWLPIAAVLGSFCCAVAAFFRTLSSEIIDQDVYLWIHSDAFRVSVGFLVDQLTAVMLLVVTSVSALVHIYSVGYMKGEEGYYRFFAYLSLFTFSMLMLVMGNNFMQLFFGWEAVGLCSYLLIGFYFEKKSALRRLVVRAGSYVVRLSARPTPWGPATLSELAALVPTPPPVELPTSPAPGLPAQVRGEGGVHVAAQALTGDTDLGRCPDPEATYRAGTLLARLHRARPAPGGALEAALGPAPDAGHTLRGRASAITSSGGRWIRPGCRIAIRAGRSTMRNV